jgi:hypothetical protein
MFIIRVWHNGKVREGYRAYLAKGGGARPVVADRKELKERPGRSKREVGTGERERRRRA